MIRDDAKKLDQWNRGVVTETITLLEKVQEQVSDAVSRLRGLLAVNPGGESIPPAATPTRAAKGKA
jgi:hypothetical protein